MPARFSAGVEEGDVLRAARAWGDGARRVAQYLAQYLAHYFHNVVEEPFRRRGLGDNQAFEAAIREVGLRIGRSGEEMLSWLYRRQARSSARVTAAKPRIKAHSEKSSEIVITPPRCSMKRS
jgi:hypothetical protein